MADYNISIFPAQLEFIIKPGISATQAYEITNGSDTAINLTSSVEAWLPQGSDGGVNYLNVPINPGISFSLANSDLRLGQNFVLKPHEKKQLVLKIQTSNQVELGDAYYTFFIVQDTESMINSGSTGAIAKIGSHLLMSVSNDENIPIKAKLSNFSTSPKIKDIFFTPVSFTAQIENRSIHFFKSGGKITITKNNRSIKELKLQPSNVLSGHSRNILCDNFTQCTLSTPLWPGNYQATLELDSSASASPVSVSFYVMPLSLILPLFIIGLLVFVLKICQHPSLKSV